MYNDVVWLAPDNIEFPDVSSALTEPNGLLAFGGDLSPPRLIAAYQQGIFPWYSEDQPIMWWSPDPRCVLFPDQFNLTRSLKKSIEHKGYRVTIDEAFHDVIYCCAQPRGEQQGTWITQEMIDAYCLLHEMGIAHSVEVWEENNLVGGLYGVDVGRVFVGESMFSFVTDASKIALYFLVERLKLRENSLIDCQVASEHLMSMGAVNISREEYLRILRAGISDQ